MMDGDLAEAWPAADLERLGRCPSCGDDHRSILFEGLRDGAFRAGPGRWTMWRCAGCGAAYLDPRPTEDSIGRAYANYYTHQLPTSNVPQDRQNFKIRLRLGHYNRRFGYRFPTGLALGGLLYLVFSGRARMADMAIRHLPAPQHGSRLLDVGSGNGAFLLTARDLGYAAIGLEPDEAAAAHAREAGLDVRSGLLPQSGLPPGSFDQVCLSHVFEHLHHPREAAAELFRLLRPGGRIWLSQPNLGAIGLGIFGEHWRGLEAPRHLCLHTDGSLKRLLKEAGFRDMRVLAAEEAATFYFQRSLAMQQGLDLRTTPVSPDWDQAWEKRVADANRDARRDPRLSESLTMVAWR